VHDAPRRRQWIRRHSSVVRLTHWVNVVCLTVLLMSGLQIFNAHPALYWGNYSDFAHPLFAIRAERTADGGAKGITDVLGWKLNTTGVLGLSRDAAGHPWARAFPAWATLPSWQSLADGRLWHFFFAWALALNGLVYLVYGVSGGHFRRDMLPSRHDLAHIGRSIRDHIRFRFPRGEAARRYNVLQSLAYLGVVFVLLPLMVLTGLTMSPGIDAGFPHLLTLFGGRQAARTLHFVVAFALVLFVLVHIFMVLVSGVWNNLRSMLTGWYAVPDAGVDDGR
jgi:thiosulfate reductase cytochrome b subunit